MTFNFDDVTGASISTTQSDTGNRLVYNATYGSFDRSGFNAIHAIQLSGATHGGAGDYAVMIYGDNVVTQKTGFAQMMGGALEQVNDTMLESRRLQTAYEKGEDLPLTDVVLGMQKSSIAFEATLQIRNKVLKAYEDILNMPV